MRWLLGTLVLCASWGLTELSWAECKVFETAPTYTAGQLKDITCDTHGIIGVGGGPGSATAAAPTLVEGSTGSFSFDLAGNARVAIGTATTAAPTYIEGASSTFSFDLDGNARFTMGTLLSGENQDSDLLMTSGGAVRLTQILGTGGVPSTATDATSATSILPVGTKTLMGVVTCTGTCVQTQKIYGTWLNTASGTNSELLCTLTLSDTTNAHASCNVTSNWSYYFVVTTLTSGTTPLAGVFAMY